MPIVVYNFTRGAGGAPLQMKLDLDESRANEKAILDYLRSGTFFEPDVASLIVKVLGEGDVAADVGANVGFFTVLASILVGPRGRVVAFEPGAQNLTRLRANLALNNCDNVTVVEKVLVNQVGEVEFFLNSADSGGNALWDVGQWPGYLEKHDAPLRVTVPATTLDFEWEQLRLPTPKVIKIDTEGADQRVLEGASNLLARKPPFIITELHPFGLAKMGCSQESLRRCVETQGYATFGLTNAGALPRFFPAATSIQHTYIINLLFSRPEWVGEYWPTAAFDQRETR